MSKEGKSIKCSCPLCQEPIGKNFRGSGEETLYSKCWKCENEINGCYFNCNICKGTFCYECPYKKNEIIYFCPICEQKISNTFQCKWTRNEVTCLKCGKTFDPSYKPENSYHSNNIKKFKSFFCLDCNALFCQNCSKINKD